jgi:hypothetical protein
MRGAHDKVPRTIIFFFHALFFLLLILPLSKTKEYDIANQIENSKSKGDNYALQYNYRPFKLLESTSFYGIEKNISKLRKQNGKNKSRDKNSAL